MNFASMKSIAIDSSSIIIDEFYMNLTMKHFFYINLILDIALR